VPRLEWLQTARRDERVWRLAKLAADRNGWLQRLSIIPYSLYFLLLGLPINPLRESTGHPKRLFYRESLSITRYFIQNFHSWIKVEPIKQKQQINEHIRRLVSHMSHVNSSDIMAITAPLEQFKQLASLYADGHRKIFRCMKSTPVAFVTEFPKNFQKIIHDFTPIDKSRA
jgi:hypothetical protein